MRGRCLIAILALVWQVEVRAADTLGNGAVADQRRLGTAELMLLCAGGAPIAMAVDAQKYSCLHYLQGFIDAHVTAMGRLRWAASEDPAITLPRNAISCVSRERVTPAVLIELLEKRYSTMEALSRHPQADGALTRILIDVYPCKWDAD
jgi:ActR/RegA family two-component response regulator